MTLGSGAHVKIGTYEYLLDESVQNHYSHRFERNQLSRQDIVGDAGKYNARPEKLFWEMTDWAGGEGNRIYYPDDPAVYSKSNGLNPRIRGQLTGRPARAVTTVATDDQRNRGVLTVGQSQLWMAQSRDNISYSANGTSWTTKTQAEVGLNTLSASYRITAATGDMDYLYYAGWHSGGSGTRVVKRIQTSGNSTTIVAEATTAVAYAGIAVLAGMVYLWTGHRLTQVDPTATMPATPFRVSPSLSEPPTGSVFGSNYWANCVATENSVVCFYTTDAQSYVYEFNPERGFYQIWKAPYGFSIKCMQYMNGILYFAGHWGGDSNANGFGALYAMRLDNRTPVFINWFRKHDGGSNLQMQEMATSYGSQIMVAAANIGRIFVYDTEMDGVSQLDHLSISAGTGGTQENNTDALAFTTLDHKIADMITYGNKRVVLVYRPGAGAAGTTVQAVSYDDDEPEERQVGNATSSVKAPLFSGVHDFDVPFEAKTLSGFHVGWRIDDSTQTSGLAIGGSILVEYSLDGTNFTTAATIDKDTVPSSGVKGRHFIVIGSGSSTTRFFTIQVRVSLIGTRVSSTNYAPPVLYALTTEASVASYTELWELVLRVKDEKPQTRPSTRSWHAEALRDNLEDLAQNRTNVTFLDGYRYRRGRGPGPTGTVGYTTQVVTVEDMTDDIQRDAEGVMRVRLRAVSA